MTLCIVDMQPYFKASDKVLDPVLREVKRAKKNNSGIVVLEFSGCGETCEQIAHALRNYGRKVYATKAMDDGSKAFLKAAKKVKFPTKNVTVVGVNRGYCVLSTVSGLMHSKNVHIIKVIMDATWGSNPEIEGMDLTRLGNHPNGKVKII